MVSIHKHTGNLLPASPFSTIALSGWSFLSILRRLRHVQNVVVPLMLDFFLVHVEEVHICNGVPITAPIGEVPLLADREPSSTSLFLCLNSLPISLLYILWRGQHVLSIASCWIHLDMTELLCRFQNSSHRQFFLRCTSSSSTRDICAWYIRLLCRVLRNATP